MSKSLPSSALVLFAGLFLACSADDGTPTIATAKTEPEAPVADAPKTEPTPPAPTPPNVDPGDKGKVVADALAQKIMGTYAMRLSVATVQTVPLLGKQPTTSHAFAVVTIARDGSGLSMTERGCHVDVVGSSSVTTTIPDAIASSIPATSRELRAWEEGSVVKWARPLAVVPVGVKLANPEKDALPTMASDSRVWDQDGDGQPGVTVKVAGLASGDIYVVQRQANALGGELGATGDLAGLVADSSQQSVIGSTNPLLNQNIPVTLDPDQSKTRVVLVKDKAGLTCPDMMSRKAQLFANK